MSTTIKTKSRYGYQDLDEIWAGATILIFAHIQEGTLIPTSQLDQALKDQALKRQQDADGLAHAN